MFASLGKDTNCQKNQSPRCNSDSASLLPSLFLTLFILHLSFLSCRFGQFKLLLVHRTQSFSRMKGIKPVSLPLYFEWIWFLPNFSFWRFFSWDRMLSRTRSCFLQSLSLLWVPWDRASVSPTSPSFSLSISLCSNTSLLTLLSVI